MARKTRKTRKETEEVELEVEEVATEEVQAAKPQPGIETWLIAVTWFALVAGFIIINMKLREVSGSGWPV